MRVYSQHHTRKDAALQGMSMCYDHAPCASRRVWHTLQPVVNPEVASHMVGPALLASVPAVDPTALNRYCLG